VAPAPKEGKTPHVPRRSVKVRVFCAGVVNLFFNYDFSTKSLAFSLIGITISWIFLRIAVEYNQKVD
jgi:hypothetical protein